MFQPDWLIFRIPHQCFQVERPKSLNSEVVVHLCRFSMFRSLEQFFLAKLFIFMLLFLLIGIGQLDNDVLKKCASKHFNSFSLAQRAPLNLNVNYVTVMRYTCTYQISYKTEIFKSFYSMYFYLDLLLSK